METANVTTAVETQESKLDRFVKTVLSHSHMSYSIVMDGFKIQATNRKDIDWVECVMSFDPQWPHTNYFYSKRDEESLKHAIKDKIADEKSTYFDKGGYYTEERLIKFIENF